MSCIPAGWSVGIYCATVPTQGVLWLYLYGTIFLPNDHRNFDAAAQGLLNW